MISRPHDLELARADADTEYVAEAAAHVSKALALDVPAGPDGKPSALLGPLRHLQRRLAVRADIFGESRTPEEGAVSGGQGVKGEAGGPGPGGHV